MILMRDISLMTFILMPYILSKVYVYILKVESKYFQLVLNTVSVFYYKHSIKMLYLLFKKNTKNLNNFLQKLVR